MGKEKKALSEQLLDFRNTPVVDKVGVEERIERFQSRSIKGESKKQGLRMALNL